MKLHIDDHVFVYAWDRPWEDRVGVVTDFFHLLNDEDLEGIFATATIDHSSYSLLREINPGRCAPERLRDHETPRL